MPRMLRPAITALVAIGLLLLGATGAPAATITSSTKLLPSDAPGSARYGMSVALSSDGTIGLVGAPYATPTGKAYLLTKSGSTWTEAAILTASDAGGVYNGFGNAVALSADGLRAFVGAPSAKVGTVTAGAVYVFSRATTTDPFVEEAKITAPTPTASTDFAGTLAASADGTHLIIGAAAQGVDYRGGAYFFARGTGGTWTAAGSITGASESALMGMSVAMSADGSTAAVGSPNYKYLVNGKTTYHPNVVTLTRSGSYWSYTKTISAPTGASTSTNSFGGGALSFTSNGQRLLIGAPGQGYVGTTPVTGAGYLYTWSGTAWSTTPTSFTAAASGSGGRQMGHSGAIAGDGSAVLLGGVNGNAYSTSTYGGGAVWKWNRTTTGTWPTAPNDVFHGYDVVAGDRFGQSLAIGADPAHPLVGATAQSSYAGAAYAF